MEDNTDKQVKLNNSILFALIGGVIVLLVVAILFVSLWYRNLTRRDFLFLSSHLHKKVEERLFELGLDPEHTLTGKEIPRRSGGTNWLFKETKILVSPQRSLFQLSLLLTKVLSFF